MGCLTTQHGAARANSVRDLFCEVRSAFELMAVARDELAVMTVMCASGSANRNLPSRKFAQSNLHPPTQILVVAKPETLHRDQKVALRCTAIQAAYIFATRIWCRRPASVVKRLFLSAD